MKTKKIKRIKAYTDLEQSKKLAEILSIKSSDNHYVRTVTDFRGNPVDACYEMILKLHELDAL